MNSGYLDLNVFVVGNSLFELKLDLFLLPKMNELETLLVRPKIKAFCISLIFFIIFVLILILIQYLSTELEKYL